MIPVISFFPDKLGVEPSMINLFKNLTADFRRLSQIIRDKEIWFLARLARKKVCVNLRVSAVNFLNALRYALSVFPLAPFAPLRETNIFRPLFH